MRAALARPALVALLVAVAAFPGIARAQNGDRFDISATASKNIQRLHSIDADTLGLSYGTAYSGAVLVDFRAIDLPFGKGAKPSLHLTGGVTTDELILAPALPGMDTDAFPMIDFASGVFLELPLETFLKGNAGVALRVGWDGGYMLTRSGGQEFLERSKLRVDFVRTSGGLQGSSIGFGKGRDEIYGWDASSNRWDVRASLQGRIWSAPGVAPAPPPAKPGAPKPATPPRAPGTGRLMWVFADIDVDTDGSTGPDGLRARVGLGLDVNAFCTALFTPLRP